MSIRLSISEAAHTALVLASDLRSVASHREGGLAAAALAQAGQAEELFFRLTGLAILELEAFHDIASEAAASGTFLFSEDASLSEGEEEEEEEEEAPAGEPSQASQGPSGALPSTGLSVTPSVVEELPCAARGRALAGARFGEEPATPARPPVVAAPPAEPATPARPPVGGQSVASALRAGKTEREAVTPPAGASVGGAALRRAMQQKAKR